jgi:ComF family protein
MKPLIKKAQVLLSDFILLLYPRECTCCHQSLLRQEKFICFDCLVGLPRNQFHLEQGNPVERLFWGRLTIEKATSYFHFQKGSKYQKMLHALKYKGVRDIGVEMGRMMAAEISDSGFFGGIDRIVPVPLHPAKEKKRGYNQSDAIAEGISQMVSIPVDNTSLQRARHSDTQTRKGRWERWKNVETLFHVANPEALAGKHVLLVDDVVTTGSFCRKEKRKYFCSPDYLTFLRCGNLLILRGNMKVINKLVMIIF